MLQDALVKDSVFMSSTDKNQSKLVQDVVADTTPSEMDDKDVAETKIVDRKGGENCPKGAPLEEIGASGDVNMEVPITPDDVIRAGGFGARDDIGSFLPVASDSTDFEASIRDARDYEEPQGEVSRPGLGWTGTTKEE